MAVRPVRLESPPSDGIGLGSLSHLQGHPQLLCLEERGRNGRFFYGVGPPFSHNF